MSDEGRRYVKVHSPFSGSTFWLHYVLGDMANAMHGYELWMGDARIEAEWPLSKRAIQRGRAELVEGGFLTILEPAVGRRPARVRFEFPDVPEVGRQSGDLSDGMARQSGAIGRQKVTNRSPKLETPPITQLKELKGTEASVAALRGFPEFWEVYPKRNGRKNGKRLCINIWKRLSLTDRRAAWRGACNLADAVAADLTLAKDPERFLKHRVWEDWQEAAKADVRRPRNDQAAGVGYLLDRIEEDVTGARP